MECRPCTYNLVGVHDLFIIFLVLQHFHKDSVLAIVEPENLNRKIY